ncbi:MAG: VanZ family protein [Moraxella sp.]|nr:VanZ family protein [Moraxella sp.]
MTKTTATLWIYLATFWFGMSIYGLFLQIPSAQPPPFIHMDKVAHWGLFFGQFYLLGQVCFYKNGRIAYGKLLLLALIWAVSSELIQGYFTNRTMDRWDATADMCGAICALGLLRLKTNV